MEENECLAGGSVDSIGWIYYYKYFKVSGGKVSHFLCLSFAAHIRKRLADTDNTVRRSFRFPLDLLQVIPRLPPSRPNDLP